MEGFSLMYPMTVLSESAPRLPLPRLVGLPMGALLRGQEAVGLFRRWEQVQGLLRGPCTDANGCGRGERRRSQQPGSNEVGDGCCRLGCAVALDRPVRPGPPALDHREPGRCFR
jgi:hypothetical protein